MKSPAFQLYPKDALADTLHLSPEEFTAYWRLIFLAWLGVDGAQQGHLPAADDQTLQRMTGLTAAQWKKAKGVLRLFSTNGSGELYNKRLVLELDKQAGLRESRSKAGKASARAKQERNKDSTQSQQDANNATTNGSTKINSPICSLQEEEEKNRTEDSSGAAKPAHRLSKHQQTVKGVEDFFRTREVSPPSPPVIAKWLSEIDLGDLLTILEDLEGSGKLFKLGDGLEPYIFKIIQGRPAA